MPAKAGIQKGLKMLDSRLRLPAGRQAGMTTEASEEKPGLLR
jgi:hypothetical protein